MSVLRDQADRALILAAIAYRSGPDSVNSVYMGSFAQARLCQLLGGKYGQHDFKALVAAADRQKLDAALDYCQRWIEYMLENPTTACPCCGQIMPAKPS